MAKILHPARLHGNLTWTRRELLQENHRLEADKSRLVYAIIQLTNQMAKQTNPDMSAVKTDKEHFTKGLQ